MRADLRPGMPLRLPLSDRWLALLVVAFLLPGLIAHDPWKPDDATGFGVVFAMLEGGSWLTPQLAGSPWLHDGPLYYWLAAGLARWLGPLLGEPGAARIASLAGIVAALYFTRLAARELYGKRAGDLAGLVLLGCGGLVLQARACTPEPLALAGVAAYCYGAAITWKKPMKGGIVLGSGLAVSLLASGLPALLPPLAALLILLPSASASRNRPFVRAASAGLLAAVLLSSPWFIALAMTAPDWLAAWLRAQVSLVFSAPGIRPTLDHLRTLGWATWPAWPLALWAVWVNRRALGGVEARVPLATCLTFLVLLLVNPAPRSIDLLVVLAPLSIPAGLAALQLRRGAANALAWFSVMTFTLLIALLWLVWGATTLGTPAQLASAAARLEPGYVHAVHAPALLLAAAATLLWIGLIRRTRLMPLREIPLWTGAVTVTTAIVLGLGVTWIDHGKSYRGVAEALRDQVPAAHRCIASVGLGDVQRAMFHYHGGLTTRHHPVIPAGESAEELAGCDVLLVQDYARDPATPVGAAWRLVLETSRPRDRERFRLYVREETP
jgi:4-amino-4-deoxy-L-arabinose transferase-like glycosyltransferase